MKNSGHMRMSTETTEEVYQTLNDTLNNTSGSTCLQERFRALFTLKALGTDQAVDMIAECFSDPSALLKHECAYVLGQMGNTHAVGTLEFILKDTQQDPMVRHEAGEAIGAIGSASSLPLLRHFSSDPNQVIAETCQLSIERISRMYDKSHPDHGLLAKDMPISNVNENAASHTTGTIFASVDPAPAETRVITIEELTAQLLDQDVPLYDRYKAMFALRNMNTSESALALAKGFEHEQKSSLFRHEIAYVLGQMQQPSTVQALSCVLALGDAELPMVRHECAEALGAIATPEANRILSQYVHDKDDVVKESCIVALDILEYENDPATFQYADGLLKARVKEMKERAN